MNMPSDYESAQAFDGQSSKQLTIGGHICRIMNARIDKTRNGKDMLVIAFDINEGSEFDGMFRERYNKYGKNDPSAKWPAGGIFRVCTTNKDGKTNGFFKGFIEAVEKSNTAYNFRSTGYNEKSLANHIVGFNFGEEEYEDRNTGELKVAIKPFYAVTAEAVNSGELIPPARKKLAVDQSYGGYSAPAAASTSDQFEETDDALPF